MKEIVNYIKESKNLHALFSVNKKYGKPIQVVIIHDSYDDPDDYQDFHACRFTEKDLKYLLNKNAYTKEQTKKLQEVFDEAFNKNKWKTALIIPERKIYTYEEEFSLYKDIKKDPFYKTEETDITIDYKDFNIEYWEKHDWT